MTNVVLQIKMSLLEILLSTIFRIVFPEKTIVFGTGF